MFNLSHFNLLDTLIQLLFNFAALFTAISFHEFSHGYVAYKLGDPTAKNMGRLTLNPLSHLDPIGALMMIFFRFGWAKPVPVNPYYFKEPKRDMAIVAFAGPVANIFLAFICSTLCGIFHVIGLKLFSHMAVYRVVYFIAEFFLNCSALNVFFAVFNLIPFPPLDGSKILFSILPTEAYNKLLTYERYGTIILILLSVTGILSNVLSKVAYPVLSVMSLWTNFLINLLSGIF